MLPDNTKVMDLKEAIKKFVFDGCHICFSGFTVSRNPMAAIYEIIRHKFKDLHIYTHSFGHGIDEMIGAGCVSKIETSYGGEGKHAPTAIRYAKAIREGKMLFEDYTNYQMVLRFQAGATGVPFLPVRSSLGTDVIEKWGFPRSLRESNDKIPNKKLVVMDNPFEDWCDTSKVVLVPAICPDVSIIHVQKADPRGTNRIMGLTYADIDVAKSAKCLIITCEELVSEEELRIDSDLNQIPLINVDAVVHAPYGAYPTACYRYYDYDDIYLRDYVKLAKDDKLFQEHLDKYVYGTSSHKELLDLIGSERLDMIKADSRTGYALNLLGK